MCNGELEVQWMACGLQTQGGKFWIQKLVGDYTMVRNIYDSFPGNSF